MTALDHGAPHADLLKDALLWHLRPDLKQLLEQVRAEKVRRATAALRARLRDTAQEVAATMRSLVWGFISKETDANIPPRCIRRVFPRSVFLGRPFSWDECAGRWDIYVQHELHRQVRTSLDTVGLQSATVDVRMRGCAPHSKR